MKEIPNYKEKRLIVARYFINQKAKGKSFKDVDIFHMWNNYFPSDFRLSRNQKFKLQEGKIVFPNTYIKVSKAVLKKYDNRWKECLSWVVKYVEEQDLNKCDADLAKVRRKQERILKNICKNIGYGAKLCSEPKNKLADYHIFKKDFHRSGYYETIKKKIQDIKNEENECRTYSHH